MPDFWRNSDQCDTNVEPDVDFDHFRISTVTYTCRFSRRTYRLAYSHLLEFSAVYSPVSISLV
jgi:hypothetical protein